MSTDHYGFIAGEQADTGSAAEAGISPDRILAITASVDEWLDAEDGGQYQAQPLARTWARVAKVSNEANEALEALSCATGQNPRKGTCKTEDDVLGELADTILTAFVAIRHITKDDARTWGVVTAGFEKAAARVATARHMVRWLDGGDTHPGETDLMPADDDRDPFAAVREYRIYIDEDGDGIRMLGPCAETIGCLFGRLFDAYPSMREDIGLGSLIDAALEHERDKERSHAAQTCSQREPDGPLAGDDDPYVNDVIGDQT